MFDARSGATGDRCVWLAGANAETVAKKRAVVCIIAVHLSHREREARQKFRFVPKSHKKSIIISRDEAKTQLYSIPEYQRARKARQKSEYIVNSNQQNFWKTHHIPQNLETRRT